MNKINSMLNVGIAGYGVVGKIRKKYIDEHPNLNTVAICDVRFKDDLTLISSNYLDYDYNKLECNIEALTAQPSKDIQYFRDYEKMIEKCNLDIVFICLPNYLAASSTIIALKNGCHVFCEKPPARSVEELEDVIKYCKSNPKAKLKYGFNHRYHESIKTAQKIIQSDEYGKIVSFRGVYGKSAIIPFKTGWRAKKEFAGGGILLDQGIHMLDLIRYFSGDYDEIHSFITNDYWKNDVEDNAFILMRNKEGQIASLHSTATQWQHRFRLEIILNEGILELSGILSGSKSYGAETLKIIRRDSNKSSSREVKILTFTEDNSWEEEIREFTDCVINNNTVKHGNYLDALKVMQMVFKIYKSDKKWWKYNATN